MKNYNEPVIAVVGAGIGGLYTAYQLQKRGYAVNVFDASKCVGGRMSSIFDGEFHLDLGANFLVAGYRLITELLKELGLGDSWRQADQSGRHYTVRDGQLHLMEMSGLLSIFRWSALSWSSRIGMIKMFIKAMSYGRLNFFDLASLPSELNTESAYDYVAKHVGQDAADYLIDPFVSMYQFHSSKEISAVAMFALMNMLGNNPGAFTRYNTFPGQMSMIPEALARRLNVKTSCPIEEIVGGGSRHAKVTIRFGEETQIFSKVVVATTADVTKKIYKNPTPAQKRFLESVQYASTINVSFRIPATALGDIACVAVPYQENETISEYTNERTKGIERNGETLVNVGLHEQAARQMLDYPDETIFEIVKRELCLASPRVQFDKLRNYRLQRWPKAMPKLTVEYIDEIKSFNRNGQGDNGIYIAGDILGPWTEGAAFSGKSVASMIDFDLRHRRYLTTTRIKA